MLHSLTVLHSFCVLCMIYSLVSLCIVYLLCTVIKSNNNYSYIWIVSVKLQVQHHNNLNQKK